MIEPRRQKTNHRIFEIKVPAKGPFTNKVAELAGGAIEQLLALDKLDAFYERLDHGIPELDFMAQALERFEIEYRVSDEDRALIPKEGPAVVVANHPFGGIEGVIMGHLLKSIRPDVKIMANRMLHRIPELRELFIFVDVFETEAGFGVNMRALREALDWMKKGGLLVIFPAGEVSSLNLKQRTVTDPAWNHVAVKIARRTGADIIPAFFDGTNGHLFQLAGLLHPRLRTIMLPRELLNKSRRDLKLRIGPAIPSRTLKGLEDDQARTAYVRWRTYALGREDKHPRLNLKALTRLRRTHATDRAEEIEPGRPTELIMGDVARLGPEATLLQSGKYRVILAQAAQIPNLLHELGRLREITFRAVGEGTGQPLDLDEFDQTYLHLILLNQEAGEVVGAYRLGQADRILSRSGRQGLYTAGLFKFKRPFFDRINPALELGRSFVRTEYQRSYSSLLLLWKGIGQFLIRNPHYRYLFGPVSCSESYSQLSRKLIMDYIQTHYPSDLAELIKPRKPVRLKKLKGFDHRDFIRGLVDPEVVSRTVADIEGSELGMPILFRQYLKLSAKAACWNVDPDFGQVIDCLMVIDLLETDPKTMGHYLGKDGYQAFLSAHRPDDSDLHRAA